jgi:hypothetical protein
MLRRRFFMRVVTSIEDIQSKHNLLSFRVMTDQGPVEFAMRSSHSQALDFGRGGKVLIDVDDNRYLIEDVAALCKRDRLLFCRHVYW